MTPEETLKRSAEAIIAGLEGKPTQYSHINKNEWMHVDVRDAAPFGVNLREFKFRAKPEKKRVPWEQDDVPGTCWLRRSETDQEPVLVVRTTPFGVEFMVRDGTRPVNWDELEKFIHSPRPQLDNNEWLPCSKEVEG